RHVFRRLTLVALDPKVLGLERRATFEETQSALACTWSPMDEPMPGEIVDMPGSTGHEEAGGNGIRILSAAGTGSAPGPAMHEARALRAISIWDQCEKAGVERRQQLAFHTPKPARKRPYGNADQRLSREGIRDVALTDRRNAQRFHLWTQDTLHVREQSA